MLNKENEQIRNEIIEILSNGRTHADSTPAMDKKTKKLCACSALDDCTDCAFFFNTYGGENCCEEMRNWLNSEYKEPKKYIDWNSVPIDTPILVKDVKEDKWIKRYFSGYYDSKVHAFANGRTSWSNECGYDVFGWKYAKLAREEDKEKYEKIED